MLSLPLLCLVGSLTAVSAMNRIRVGRWYYRDELHAWQPEPVGPVCPPAPVRPDVGDNCNWIPVMDKKNCILKYECEPIPPEVCNPPPIVPDENERCKWLAIKDKSGCIIDFECIPVEPVPPPPPPPPISSLRDLNPVCCYWASLGECVKNGAFMRVNCQRSCATPGCGGAFESQACEGYLRLAGCTYLQPTPAFRHPLFPFLRK